ncbi:MAG: LptF/LptG family permease [Pirellulales bacterium]|nr:LptF/LptG family permease [Pirellulales bacterium]MBL7194456.1 LptF/LptG family permease [Pirellulales bacterium]
MKIVARYVLAELMQVFLVTLAALTLFMLIVGLVKEAQQQGLGPVQIAMLVPYVLPEAMRFAVPGTMLFAVASVFGRMSATNEITALKAAGVTPLVAIWPALAFALTLSFVSVWLNDVAVSWGRDGIRRVIVGSVEEIVYGRLRQQRSYSSNNISINVKGVEGRTLIRPTLSFQPGGNSPPVTVSAAEAELRADPEAETLSIICRDGTLRVGDVTAVFPDTIERVLPMDAVSREDTGRKSPSEIAMADFEQEHADQLVLIDTLEQAAAARIGSNILAGRMDLARPEVVAFEREVLSNERSRLQRIVMEPWRRWANGFSCLCFAVVGAPMAIRMRNSDFLTSFFLCFLPILVVYYPLLMFGIDRVKAGELPPIAVWIGNLLVTVWGIWLLRRVVRN